MTLNVMHPFTRREALRAGLTDVQLRSRDFLKLFGAVYISSNAGSSPFVRAAGALLVHPPDAIGSHFTVARLIGAPVPDDPLEHVTVSNPCDRRQRHGIRCHVAAIAEHDVWVLRGLRLSRPQRMFVELAGHLHLVDLVVLGDWLVRHGHATPAELRKYCAKSRLRYARRAREAAAYVRDEVDSPMETRLRMLIVLAGLPEPQVNFKIVDEDGRVVLRADLAYPSVRLAVEYDGRHHDEKTQKARDGERRDDFEDGAWRLLVVRSRGIYIDPDRTLQRVWRALSSRGFQPLTPAHRGLEATLRALTRPMRDHRGASRGHVRAQDRSET